eukprot:scaffold248591_cov66-Cyclotella_meneghiniana.AAC.1
MVDTTISSSAHDNSIIKTQQSTELSIAYRINRNNRHAASIDVSTQQNSCHGFDGWPIMVQVQVL